MSRLSTRSLARAVYELLSSMRFAISLLTILAIAAIVGTVLKQNEAYNAYLNQFGPFWFPIFEKLGLYSVYHAGWFLAILTFLVLSTSLCIARQGPLMVREMRSFRQHAQESSLRQFAHQTHFSTPLGAEQAQQRVLGHLKQSGFRARIDVRADGRLIAAKAGSGNRLGYLLTHSAIVLICIGGLLDGDLPLKAQLMFGDRRVTSGNQSLSGVPAESRLAADHWSYRGNVFLPEGQRSGVAVLNVGDGILVQDLPFDLTLKKFSVDFYSTGAPKRFASDVTVTDRATGQTFDRTIEVNKPFEYKGITLYQASFDDGGSRLRLQARSLSLASREALAVEGEVGTAVKLTYRGNPVTIELTGLRPINVENFGRESSDAGALAALDKHLGSAARTDAKNLRNVGPSFTFKVRDAAGQAKEFNNYMLPVEQDGRRFFVTGMRESQAEPFRYLRIPADEAGRLDTWFALRALLTDPQRRSALARRFTDTALKGEAVSETMHSKLVATTEQTLSLYATGGYEALDKFIRQSVPEAEQQKAAEVFVKVLQGAAWEGWRQLQADLKQAPLEMNAARALFVSDALNSISDSFHYGSPFYLELTGFDEVKASVIQATRSPGKSVVYLGCALLVAGVGFMLYIRERRLFVLLKSSGEAVIAMASNRKVLDFDAEFTRHCDALRRLLTDSTHGTDAPHA